MLQMSLLETQRRMRSEIADLIRCARWPLLPIKETMC